MAKFSRTQFRQTVKLGSGGFGEVWLCTRQDDGGTYAKKNLLETVDSDGVARFQREVRILSQLDHPHIVRVVEHQLHSPPYWYVMPSYKHTLSQALPSVEGDVKRIAVIFSAILSGIEYAHSEGVIHRDLKPENILMNDDTDVVITDFGLGRRLDSDSTRYTITGFGMGSFFYMAPEQMINAKNADHRSDIYSLGRMLFAALTGALSSTMTDTSSLDDGLAHVINKCTQSSPQKRYQTAADLRRELMLVLGETQTLSPYGEITTLVSQLMSTTPPVSPETEQRLLDLLTQNRSDTDMIHEVVMQLPSQVAHLLLSVDREQMLRVDMLFRLTCNVAVVGFFLHRQDRYAVPNAVLLLGGRKDSSGIAQVRPRCGLRA